MFCAALLILVSASPETRLQGAERALTASEFERSTKESESLLANATLDSAQSARAQRTAAFAQFYLGEKVVAESHLEEYFKLQPDAQIDAKHYPPDLVAFFNRVKANQKPMTAKPTGTPPPTTDSAAPKAEHRPFSAKSLVPFGIGQMLLGDYTAGGLFLGLDAAFFATDLALYFVRIKDRQANGGYTNVSRAQALQIGQDVAAGALIVSTIIGIVDACVWSPDRVANKPVSVIVSPLSQGAMLSTTLSFP